MFDPLSAMDDFRTGSLFFQGLDEAQSSDGHDYKNNVQNDIIPELFKDCSESILPEETSLFEDCEFNTPKSYKAKKSGFCNKIARKDEPCCKNSSNCIHKRISKSSIVRKSSNEKRAPSLKKDLKPKEKKARINYSKMVDSIFDQSDKAIGITELSMRRDVINKRILRGFKKFISDLFQEQRIRPCRLKGKDSKFKEAIIKKGKSLNLIQPDEGSSNKHFGEFVCWMAMSKNTSKAKSLFDNSNQSISEFEDVLVKYSHKKLERIYENKDIAQTYKYFIENGIECFLQKCPEDKREVYLNCSMNIYNKFNNLY
ncbi:unnamed protein product [Moneuplotes crassus]|uniref:Uncharacterized protein n=1 Tax=Euplotes crassus TaxID=5936 RepID=A0AAD1UQN5_EUPCR|nr:unnamed protein product [Moneuplotes crassus]